MALFRIPLLQKAATSEPAKPDRPAWNAGVSVGQKAPFTVEQVRTLYHCLHEREAWRECAMFATAIDSMLRAGDLLSLKVRTVRASTGEIRTRIQVKQGKTKNPVTCVLGVEARKALSKWIERACLSGNDYLFSGRDGKSSLSRRQFQSIVKAWVSELGLPPELYGTHSLRRTKASMLYASTKDSAKVQIVLGQSTLSAAQSYLGITTEDALEAVENLDLL